MEKARIELLLLVLLLTCRGIGSAQQDTLADFLPLAIGNNWEYSFFARATFPQGHYSEIDTGFASYTVVHFQQSVDSTRWQLIRIRDFQRTAITINGPLPPVAMHDSIAFELVEMNSGSHELYIKRPNISADYGNTAVFPFWRLVDDSTRVYRYVTSTLLDTLTLSGGSSFIPNIHYDLFLGKDIGVTQSRVTMVAGGGTAFYQWDNYLQQFPVSVRDPWEESVHAHYSLSHNYPNPFNPSTTIPFILSRSSHTRLVIYDAAGRSIATLVDEVISAGRHSVSWNGWTSADTPASSGVYFYRLDVGGSVEMKKMVLLK